MLMGLFSLPGIVRVGSADDDRRTKPISALAPVEVAALGVDASGVAAESDGSILFTDKDAGALVRIDTAGRRKVLVNGLRKPTAVALDANGSALVLEQNGERLLRVTSDRRVTVVSSTLRKASAIGVGTNGQIWVSMRRIAGRDRDDDDDERDQENLIARVDGHGIATVFASGFVDVQGLAADANALFVAMARLETERGRVRTTLARIPLRANGSAGPVESWLHDSSAVPSGVALDAAGNVFITATSKDDDHDQRDEGRGVVLKRRMDGTFVTFAAGLRDPAALAFAPTGNLVVVDHEKPGRILRFIAPQVQTTDAPAFTNQTPVLLRGTSLAGARVVLARTTPPGAATVSATAAAVGTFAVSLPLESNVTNSFSMVATGAGGAGLVGAPVSMAIVHDDIPPALSVIDPLAGAHTRGPLPTTARTEDDRSGVAALTWSVDGVLSGQLNPAAPGQPFIASTVLPTGALIEGPHGIEVIAADRAGNRRTVALPIVVDRTPPDTLIVGGPSAQIAARTATFTLSGTDAWSSVAQLDYAWQLDEGPWSPFNALASITLNDLLPGEHRFEARARDRAGNEDTTPAAQTFAVRSLRLSILEPAPGAVVTSDSVWVRAAVEGGAGEVVVSVPLPAQFGIPALSAPVEGGTVALQVPADPAFTTLTLVATDASGANVHATVSIVVMPASIPEPSLELWPPGGLAPLNVRMSLHGWSGAAVTIDVEGDGTNEFDGILDGDEVLVSYERPGVYLPTVRITTPTGEVETRRGRVEVYDRAVLDARLQEVWRGFKDALRSANVQTAVNFIATDRRAAWAEYFSSRSPAYFAAIDRLFADMTLVQVGAGGAEYEVVSERNGLLYSYSVWFRIDDDGRWRLWRF